MLPSATDRPPSRRARSVPGPAVGLVVGLVVALVVGLLATTVTSATAAPAGSHDGLVTVTGVVETPAVYDDAAGGDADADDPAVWVDRRHPARSRVVATVKDAGLRVYDLQGRLVQSIAAPAAPGPDHEAGRFNNVDIVHGLPVGRRVLDVAVTSDRGRDQLRFYGIDPGTGRLRDLTADDAPLAFSADQSEVDEQRTVYGLTTYRDRRGRAFVVGTRRHTAEVGIFRILTQRGRLTYRRVDTVAFPSAFPLPDGRTWSPCEDPGEGPQLEGLVVDPTTRTLYAAQEDVGLWRQPLRGGRFAGRPVSVERVQGFGVPATYDEATEECVIDGPDPGYGGRIAADVEGLTLYRTGRRTGSLLVSSQGDDTFYVYDRRTLRPVRHVAVVDGPAADGVQDCDGADAVSTPLPGYPRGLLVVQDGDDTPHVAGDDGEDRVGTNFTYLDAGVLRP